MKNNKLYLFLIAFAVIFSACEEEPISEDAFGTLLGKVVSKGSNIPLSNVKISTTPVSTTVFTDVNGTYEIRDITIGKYSVQAEVEEFQTAFEAATILQGKTVNIVFELDSLDAGNLLPLAPNLLFPQDESQDISILTEFVWSSSDTDDDVITYALELRNGSTNEVIIFEAIQDTTLLVDNLAIGVNYFWQVSADDGVNTPVKSALSGFATKRTSSNRFSYVRNIAGNNVIFSGSASSGNTVEESNQNELQLTTVNNNSYRPIRNNIVNKIAFIRTIGTENHLFTINSDGTNSKQVTNTVPIAGFRQDEIEFSWYDNGAKIYYPNFDKLYSINLDGSGNAMKYQVANGDFITEVAVNNVNNFVAIKTNSADGYNARIVVLDINTGIEQVSVIEGLTGALGGLDFSFDGNRVLYTRDVSGVENTEYRQLDSRIFEYNISSAITTEMSTDKVSGTNDLDAKYSPDEAVVIFTNSSNDGISEKRIFRTDQNESNGRQLMFTNAFMPNWE